MENRITQIDYGKSQIEPFLLQFITLPRSKKWILHHPYPIPVECIVVLILTFYAATTTTATEKHPKNTH